MTSTNNRNLGPEYRVEKTMNKNKMDYMLNVDFSENKSIHKIFDLGGVPKLYSENMSYNNIDIESKLRGIRSTNMEGFDFNPDLKSKKLLNKELFEKQKVFIPPSFLHGSERRGFHNI